MFSNRIFGTPPTEFSRIEIPRCLEVSESHIDDIFGSYDKDILI
uniref:Kinesin motor domain-containing protein n=1 Tax=Heterorhabditis bacteriophora TaxID=37862 RepID=A0A1I7WT92_HETBA